MKTMWELFLVTHLKEETHKEVLILPHLRVDWSCVKLVTWVVQARAQEHELALQRVLQALRDSGHSHSGAS